MKKETFTLSIAALAMALLALVAAAPVASQASTPENSSMGAIEAKAIGGGNALIHIIPALSSTVCKNGQTLTIQAVVKSQALVASVEANIGGIETVALKPTPAQQGGDNRLGTTGIYQAEWTGHDLEEKVYRVAIKVTDILGRSFEDSSLEFSDPAAGNSAIGSTSYGGDTFTRIGSCNAASGENDFSCGVIDEANGYAYFGTNTSPGKVVKVSLGSGSAAPSRVAVLSLQSGENYLTSAVIDTANGYAYFGTNTTPGIVVKVALGSGAAAPTRAGALTLNSGENYLKCAAINASTGYACFGTYTSPGIAVKVALGSGAAIPTRVGAVTLDPGENLFTCAIINTSNQWVWLGTDTAPGIAVAVFLGIGANMPERVTAIPFNAGENNLTSAYIDAANDTGYFVTGTAPASIVIVDLHDSNRDAAVALNAGESPVSCCAFDSQHRWGFFGTNTSPAKVAKTAFGSRSDGVTLNTGENQARCVVADSANGYVYVGTGTSPARVVKLKNTQMKSLREIGSAVGLDASEITCGAIDATNGYAYFGTHAFPGRVVKVALGSGAAAPTRVGECQFVEGEDNVACVAIDPANGYAYFGTYHGQVIKVALGSGANPPSRVGSIALNDDLNGLQCALIDTSAGYLYFGANMSPAAVAKVSVGSGSNLPTHVATLSLSESQIYSGVIDPAHGYAYFGTYRAPGQVIKVALGSGDSAPAYVGALTLEAGVSPASGDDYLISAAIDPTNGYAYFGTGTVTYCRVVKVSLGSGSNLPTRIGSLVIGYPTFATYLNSAVIDTTSQMIYFTAENPPTVLKISLGSGASLPTYVDHLTLGEEPRCLVGDLANGYAYASENVTGGKISKVSFGSGTNAPTLTAETQFGGAENAFTSVLLDEANRHAYTASYNGALAKFDLGSGVNPPTRLGGAIGTNYVAGAFVDPARGSAYVVSLLGITARYSIGDGSNPPTFLGWSALSWDLVNVTSAAYDETSGYAYYGGYASPAVVYKVDPTGTASLTPVIGTLTLDTGENRITSMVTDSVHGYGYLCVDTTPARIIKISLGAGTAAPTRVGALDLNADDGIAGPLLLDSAHGYLYAFSYVDQGGASAPRVVKIDPGTGAALPTRIGAMKTGDYVARGGASFLDTTNGIGYAINENTLVKFSLGAGTAVPTRLGTYLLPRTPGDAFSSAFDSTTGYAYSGTMTAPGLLRKYAVSWKDAVHGTKLTLTQKASVNDVRLYSHLSGGNVRMAIYDDNGSARALKWESGSIANTQTNGWITAAISTGTPSSLVLNPGTYWVAFNTDSFNNWESFAEADAGNGFELNQAYGAFPGSIANSATTEMKGVFSQYITYTDYVNLTVASAYDSPSPAVGATEYLSGGMVNASVTSPVSGGAGIRYVCTGYTGTGSAPSGSTTSCSFTITQASTLTWNWKTQYQLATAISPSGAGSVTPANGAWIDAGTVQSVQASNNTGWQFASWSGALSGSTNPQNLTMNAAKSVTATFNPQLTIASAQGSPSPAVGTTCPTYNSTVNASVTSPVSGGAGIRYVCTGHTGTGSAPSGSTTSCSFAITQASTLTWNWKTQYQLATSISPSGAGSVTPANGAWIDAGTVQSVQASNNTGWQFASWSGALSGSTNPQNLTMNAAKSVTATFNPQLTIASAQGSPSPAVGTTCPTYNSTVNASVTSPVSGGAGIRYVCTGYTGTGSAPSGSTTSCSFTITQASTLTWNWKTQYLLTTTVNPPGTGTTTPADGTWMDAGTLQSVEAVGNPGWQLGSWSGALSGSTNPQDLTMDAPKSVSASFNPALTVLSDHGMPSPSVGTTYLTHNMTLEAFVNSPVDGDAGVRYVCTGYTGTGDVPASGTDPLCNFTLTQPSTLTWNWKTQYQLSYSAGFHGSIQGDTPQWVDSGASGSEILALADPGYLFIDWSDLSTQNPRTDTNVTGPIFVSADFEDRTPPSSALTALADRTIVGPSIILPYTASNEGSGLAFVTLWVKAPGSDAFAETDFKEYVQSGAFNYTFTAGDGAYAFATKAIDGVQNAEPNPVAPRVVVYVNDIENSDYTTTLTAADATTTFPMTNDLDMIIAITGATPGGAITVSRAVGNTAPPGYDPASFIDESLTITGTGLGSGWSATLTWNFDPANNTLGAALDTLYQFDGTGNYTRRFTITPTGSTLFVPGLTSFSDWYAGELVAPSEISDWTLMR